MTAPAASKRPALARKSSSPVLPGRALREAGSQKEPLPLSILQALTPTVNVTLEQASFQ